MGENFNALAEARAVVESWRRFYNSLRVGGCTTSTGVAVRAGAKAANKLAFHPNHSSGANQCPIQHRSAKPSRGI